MADVNISKYRASVVRSGSAPATPGFVVSEGQNPVEPAGSEQNHLPVTINATATGLAITTDQVLSGAGTVGQYIRGDGSLADFPASTGGGSSVSYYLNGSISQGTIGGVAYKELSKTPILGAGTQFTINADGYIASFLTDAGDPNLLEIPGGNWNFETYFSASSGGGSPTFYVELYKYDGSTFTLIASNSGSPELIAFGTNVNSYFSTLAVPTTALTLTDRLAIRYYVTHSGRTITLHTENNTLCQIITTFTTGLTALNGLTAQVQYFAVGTSGTDFNIASATQTHTFNLPTASASNRGALSSSDWTTFNNKQNALTNPVTGTGTTNYLPKFTGTSSIGNSIVQDAGIRVDIGGDIRLTPSSAVNIQAYTGSVYTNLFYNAASHNWQTSGGATKMFLNSNDNLLIGTTTDGGQRLQVTGTFALRASASGSSATQIPIFNADPSGTTRELVTRTPAQLLSDIGGQAALTNPVTGTGTTNYLPKFTGTSTIGNSNLINDSSGNLGLGVTPSAWDPSSNVKVLQMNAGSIWGFSTVAFLMVQNSFSNTSGVRTYVNNGFASEYEQASGQHIWKTAPSGTAGNAITFTQAMTLTSGGNLLVGTTTDAGYKLDVNGTGRINGNLSTGTGASFTTWSTSGNIDLNDVYLSLSSSGSFGGAISNNAYFNSGWKYKAANNATLYQTLAGEHRFFTAGVGASAGNAISFTQALTITSTGNVGIGTSSPSGLWSGDNRNLNILSPANFSSELVLSRTAGTVGAASISNFLSGTAADFGIYTSAALNYVVYTNNTERMRITSGGNVGIGTSSPGYRLVVNSATDGISAGISGNTFGIRFDNGGTFSSGMSTIHGVDNTLVGSYQPIMLNGLDVRFGTSATERMRITSGGEVLIGNTDNGAYNLQCNGTGVWGAGAYVNGSDRNIKDNIATIEKGLEYIQKMNPVKFRYKPNYTRDHSMQTGFIAQELQEVFASEDYLSGLVQQGVHLSVAYQNLLPVLVKAIQEQQEIINDLKQKIQ
jgi:hypothetical protein